VQPDAANHKVTVAVVGLGSIGGVAAGCLAKAGRHRVVACVRQPVARLKFDWPDGTAELPLCALTDPAKAEPADWVLLCTKTQDTAAAAPWLARLCTPATRVAVLQNGIDHVARVAPLVHGAKVVPVIVYYNGERLAQDPQPDRDAKLLHVRLRQGADQDLLAADDDAGRAFTQLFEGTPLRVRNSTDFATAAWRKLLINAIASPITALTMQRQAVLRRPDIKQVCLAILGEAIAVGRAEGAKFTDDDAERAMAALFTFPPDAGTSMYFDRLAGRLLEHAALTGAIVAAGKRHGIATPINRALLPLLAAISDATGKS
jgi:2-dehydropantoate 2-reductase